MKFLGSRAKSNALEFLLLAAEEAMHSTCARRKCGAVMVKHGDVIGMGYNSPAGNSAPRCHVNKRSYDPKVTDKTCCVHAEQRAIINALPSNDVTGATIYFASVNDDGDMLPSGDPYCTHCSKMALDVGIAFWVLKREDGIVMYGAEEYDRISHDFRA